MKTKRNGQFLEKIRAAFADLDIAKSGDGQTRDEREYKKLDLCEVLNAHCKPNRIIHTSNGIQPIWFLKNTDISKEYQERYVNAINGIIEWSKGNGAMGDAVKDTARILRVPGYNHMKEEPYMVWYQDNEVPPYDLGEIEQAFPFQAEKKYDHESPKDIKLDLISLEIDNLDFQDLIIRAFGSTGRSASFDKQGRLILDGRLTGTFQGKNGDRNYLASSSHEPYQGNRITAVADILSVTNKEARKWIVDTYNMSLTGLMQAKEKIKPKKDYLPYTWGTANLDENFWPVKRGQYIVLFGEQNSGKTAYSFDLARKNAELGHKVLFLSLEMSTDEVYERVGLEYAGYTQTEVRLNQYPESKKDMFEKKIAELKGIKLLELFGFPAGVPATTESIIRLIEEKKPDLVIVDNLDKVQVDKLKPNDRHEFVSGEFLTYCKNSGPPIILIHHTRKKSGSSSIEIRGLDEMRGSGKISDDAYYVVQVSRSMEEDSAEVEKAQLKVFQMKNRMSGQTCLKTIYHHGGSFYDQFVPSNYLTT